VVAAEDPGRFYTRSSPSANDDDVAPGTLGWGDHHFWGVWHAEQPYEKYAENTSRFMSEYGFQSFPTIETVAGYAPPAEWRIDSPVMLAHQRHPRGNQLVRSYMERDFHVPTDFAAFLYVSQVLQATIIQHGAEAHRRRWPYNAGSLYWQLDDCWPVASWAGIDYTGRWKALHYAARRFFAPVLVSPVEENGNVRIFVVSDRRADLPARLVLRLADLDGGAKGDRWSAEREVTVRANASHAAFEAERRAVLEGADPRRVVLVAELHEAGEGSALVARNLLFFAKARDLALVAPALTTAVEVQGETAAVRVTARAFARAVWLTTRDGAGVFSDNFFDLLPGETATVTWTPPAEEGPPDAARLAAALRATSIRDTY
jgi:beta-mannosidase